MNPLQDRRVQLAGGTLIVLLVAVLLATFLTRQSKPTPDNTTATAKGALQVDLGHEEARVSQTKPLRCFVNGQYVGDFPVLECAKRNGVAAQALDVGLDPATGQIAGGSAALQPLPAPTPVTAPAPTPPAADVSKAQDGPIATGPAECLRYAEGGWRGSGGVGSLNQCVRILFDNRCVHAGDALYGRYGALTLRLVPGRVEMSADNRTFRTLVAQDDDCRLPAV